VLHNEYVPLYLNPQVFIRPGRPETPDTVQSLLLTSAGSASDAIAPLAHGDETFRRHNQEVFSGRSASIRPKSRKTTPSRLASLERDCGIGKIATGEWE
jgi:hypothetical protein